MMDLNSSCTSGGTGSSWALENGVTREEIVAAITHLAFYAGRPPAMTALQIARKVFEEAGA
ncbi:carboxymuconolactone decarboxylase family protein [Roseiarcus fermentans]|uniref:Carboxymuconolactone decarboxylase family protein n=1 Tax=Roseiarcus fermentans TaxID=1473586 RepID=A0A366ELK9_9HYPH|nr:carboxymuconolactone decarboxylase family protein [Roseiarcus fermentans]RBP03271.1 carboxymuconolactone decarboxylase family protein [Roseiarcus fermentans]